MILRICNCYFIYFFYFCRWLGSCLLSLIQRSIFLLQYDEGLRQWISISARLHFLFKPFFIYAGLFLASVPNLHFHSPLLFPDPKMKNTSHIMKINIWNNQAANLNNFRCRFAGTFTFIWRYTLRNYRVVVGNHKCFSRVLVFAWYFLTE